MEMFFEISQEIKFAIKKSPAKFPGTLKPFASITKPNENQTDVIFLKYCVLIFK